MEKELESETGRGKTQIFFKDKPAYAITHKFQAGKLHALYKAREVELKEVEDNVNEHTFWQNLQMLFIEKDLNKFHSKDRCSR